MTIETANRLYELRKNHNLSQEELAEKLGVSRQAVSKWERSEASPDTDNLIALAKIYGLSLDELIYGEKEEKKKEDEPSESDGNTAETVEIGPGRIYVESNDGDKVKIDLSGISVKSDNGEKVKIDLNGIHIDCDDDDDDDDDDEEDRYLKNTYPKSKLWLDLPYPIICVIAYLLFGFLEICGGFGLSWIIFITIPIYYSLIHAIFKKRFSDFAFPVFAAFAYLFMGLYLDNWHPSWVIFITIPVYYSIAGALDKRIRNRMQKENEQ